MSMRSTILCGLIVSLSLFTAAICQDRPEAASRPNIPDSLGKAVYVKMRSGEESAALLDPEIHKLGDRSFIVGRSAETGAARNIWLPLSDVAMIDEFNDVKEMGQYYRVGNTGAAK